MEGGQRAPEPEDVGEVPKAESENPALFSGKMGDDVLLMHRPVHEESFHPREMLLDMVEERASFPLSSHGDVLVALLFPVDPDDGDHKVSAQVDRPNRASLRGCG